MGDTVNFKKICDNLNTTIFITNNEGKTLYVNPAYLERTGLTENQVVGKTIFQLQKENIIQCDIIPQMLKDGKPRNAIGYVIPTDYRGFISGIPIKDADGNIEYAMTTDWDVNTIMEMETRLKNLKIGSIEETEKSMDVADILDDNQVLYVSEQMRELMILVQTVAKTDVSVLITGETGTGKELLAGAVVKYSGRAQKPFVRINCAAIPPNLIESELFGYNEGAFTGAKRGGKKGAFEEADGGTILLDEIGELPFQVQAKLLRVLQESEITRVGGQKPIKLDIRVIAATNRNLLDEIRKGNFREDLYYRLNIIQIRIPALRERKEDIPFLVGRFLEQYNDKYHKHITLDSGVLPMLTRYEWPGNIRELKNLMERLVIVCVNGNITTLDVNNVIRVENMPFHEFSGGTLKEMVSEFEKQLMEDAIQTHKSKTAAAEALGVDRTTFVKKCQRYGLW